MTIDRVTSLPSRLEPVSQLGPFEAKSNQPKRIEPFIHDTIEKIPDPTVDNQPSIFSKIVGWLQGWFWSQEPNLSLDDNSPAGISVDSTQLKPKLQSPDEYDAKKLQGQMTEMNHLIHRIKASTEESLDSLRSDPHQQDFNYFMQLIESFKSQRSIRETEELLIKDSITLDQKSSQRLQKSNFDLSEEVEFNNKVSSVLKWTNYALTGGIVAGSLASLYFTPGLIFLALQSGATMSAGASQFAKSIVDSKNQMKERHLFDLSKQSERNKERIRQSIEDMGISMHEITNILEQLNHVLKSYYETAKLH